MSKITVGLCGSLRSLAKGMRLVDFVASNIVPGDFIIVDSCTIRSCADVEDDLYYIDGGIALNVISIGQDPGCVKGLAAVTGVVITAMIMFVSDKVEKQRTRGVKPPHDGWVTTGSLCMMHIKHESCERTALKVVHRD